MDLNQSLLQQQHQAEMTYVSKQDSMTIGGGHRQEVLDRRTSSRGGNRISAAQTANRIDSATQPNANRGGETALETVKSLPAGFDPIFNAGSNANFNDNSHIKIKPMRRSKGFDSGEISQTQENLDATESSSVSAVSREASIGTLENASGLRQETHLDLSQRTEDQAQNAQVSPIYSKMGL